METYCVSCKKLLETKLLNWVIMHLNLKLVIESGLLSRKISLGKVTPEIDQEKYL